MITETDLHKAINKSFILTFLFYGKFIDHYAVENVQNLDQVTTKLAHFTNALKVKMAEKKDERGEL